MYHGLDGEAQLRIRRWMEAEGVWEDDICELALGEGEVTLWRIAQDFHGDPVFLGDEVVLSADRRKVTTLPPPDLLQLLLG